jgi:predicted transcriptional regulator of viral defense system
MHVELQTVWHGALWRPEAPPPIVAPAPACHMRRIRQETGTYLTPEVGPRIVGALKGGEVLNARLIASRTGFAQSSVSTLLGRLCRVGKIRRVRAGWYQRQPPPG